jgi:N-acetyl-gamma-glutamyl-phosphate reductase
MKKIRVAIAGAAGYTGGELLRILVFHPDVEIIFAASKSNAGKAVWAVHTDLLGDTNLRFSNEISQDIDVIFLCMGHGESAKFLSENKLNSQIKIIDLSQDFRPVPNESFNQKFIYGLPEIWKKEVKNAQFVANPGCFATCIQLALLPLAAQKLLKSDIHINATTGSTGAGQSLSNTSHFSWRNQNISVYKAFEHQHLREISANLQQWQPDFSANINFIPQRGNFTRGILAAIYTQIDLAETEIIELYKDFYKTAAFTFVSSQNVDLKQVVNTNKCFLQLEKHQNNLFITSVIDNLLKGASGQAVQNMNLMFGLAETAGLKLKAAFF